MATKKTTAKKTAKAVKSSRAKGARPAPVKKRPAAKRSPAKKTANHTAKTTGKQKQRGISRVEVFVQRYLVHHNGRQAAIEAGYSPRSARTQASDLLALPEVQSKIQEGMHDIAQRNGMEADDVAARLVAIATADARELTEVWRCCCRYCWGDGHRFQRTPQEMVEARKNWEKELKEACKNPSKHQKEACKNPSKHQFDEEGGTGFNPYHDPNPDCPECFGRGIEAVLIKDTRDLGPEAKLLFAGVKMTQHGIQVLTHDQKGALIDYGKHIGMFTRRFEGKVDHNHRALEDMLSAIDGAGTGIPGDATE